MTTTEPTPIKNLDDNALLDLLSDVDKAIRIAGDAATGAVGFRWAILAELVIRNAR